MPQQRTPCGTYGCPLPNLHRGLCRPVPCIRKRRRQASSGTAAARVQTAVAAAARLGERRVEQFSRLPRGTTVRVLWMRTAETPRGTVVATDECYGVVKYTKKRHGTQYATIAYHADRECSGVPYETHTHDLAAPTPIFVMRRAHDVHGIAALPDMSCDSCREHDDELVHVHGAPTP